MAEAYTPIDCGLHDQLEVHAMRRDLLAVEFVDEAGRPHRLGDVRLVTWRSRGREEVGVFVDGAGHETLVRLDRLRTIVDRRTAHRLEFVAEGTRCAAPPPALDTGSRPTGERVP